MSTGKDYYNLTLQHFKYFVHVAELGTMVLASEQLNVSQPLLSQKISQLEKALDIKLFIRGKRKLELTDAGQDFLRQCKSYLEQLEDGVEDLRKKYQTSSGNTLRIGFSDGQESSSIHRMVQALEAEIPDAVIEILIENRLSVIDKVISGEVDFCFCLDTESHSSNKNINYRKLFSLPVCCIVHSSSKFAKFDQLEWKDLDGCVSYWPSSLKNTALTRDLLRLFKELELDLTLEYRDVGYFTLRKFLHDDKHLVLTLTQHVDDPTLRVCKLGGLSYPMVLCWKKGASKDLSRYVDKVLGVIKRTMS